MANINVRKNAIVKAGTEMAESVLELKKYGYGSWKKIQKYSKRWAAESFFSVIKRIFGKTVRSNSLEDMIM